MNVGNSTISISRYLNRFTLIVGEVNTGKTTFTQRILDSYRVHMGDAVVVVDLAPHISPSALKGRQAGIGGGLHVPETSNIRYFHPPLSAPRLQGKSNQETLHLAVENARCIESLFAQALAGKTDALFINDCSLYLHAGEVQRLITWIRSAKTAIVNGYYGKTLGPGPLSAREREGMEDLMNRCDRVIQLSTRTTPGG